MHQPLIRPLKYPLIAMAVCASLFTSAQTTDTAQVIIHRSLDAALRDPDHVYRLDLSNSGLKEFPMEVLQFRNLRELSLRQDSIRTLPEEIGLLRNLRVLDLGGNPISLLPEHFGDLVALEELTLSDDRSLSLERDIETLSRLPKLRILHLERDHLGVLPRNIDRLSALEELYLNDNDLRALPPTIQGLQHLKLLDLRGNPIDPLIPLDLQQRGVLIRF